MKWRPPLRGCHARTRPRHSRWPDASFPAWPPWIPPRGRAVTEGPTADLEDDLPSRDCPGAGRRACWSRSCYGYNRKPPELRGRPARLVATGCAAGIGAGGERERPYPRQVELTRGRLARRAQPRGGRRRMPSRNRPARSGAAGGGDRPVAIVGEPVPCRDARHRVWQALDLLQSYRSRRPGTSGPIGPAVPAAASDPAPHRRAR